MMKRAYCAMALMGVLLTNVSGEVEGSAEDFVKGWVAVFNENDAEKHLEFYEESKGVNVVVSAGYEFRGYKRMAKLYREEYAAARFSESRSRNLFIRDLGKTAIASFEHLFRFDVKDQELANTVHIRTTMTLVKTEEGWKVAAEHSSAIEGVKRWTEVKKRGE